MFETKAPARILLPIVAFVVLYAAVGQLVTNSYFQLVLTLVPIWAIFGVSWNLLSGTTGLISFGHAAFFGLGAYTVALGFALFGITPWLGIPIAAAIGCIAGLLIGLPTFRLRGHYFALAMLAYPLALLNVFNWLGYQEVSLPMTRGRSAAAYMQFGDYRVYEYLALCLLVAAMLAMRLIERSRFGMALLAIKQNEAAAEAAGIDAIRCKLIAITLSGGMAGAVGGFYAVVLLVVTPDAVFGMLVSAQALTMAMFGGVGTVWGPVIGALVLIPLEETLRVQFGAIVPGIQGVVYGVAIVLMILLAPEGLYWKAADGIRKRRVPSAAASGLPQALEPESIVQPRSSGPAATGDIMSVSGVSKAFGGVRAVQDVTFTVRRGEVLGVIGPNGAGKTTLFNILNGFVRPSAGTVTFEGISLARRAAERSLPCGSRPHVPSRPPFRAHVGRRQRDDRRGGERRHT